MKVKMITFSAIILILALGLGLAACNAAIKETPPIIVRFPTLSPLTETAVFESTLWTPTSTGTITLVPTATNTLTPSNTSRPSTNTPLPPTVTATQEFTDTETSTFTITVTPHHTKTPSPTPTYAAITRTPQPYACTVQEADPNGYKAMHPNDDFDAHFTVLNSGGEDWDSTKTSYRFLNGTALQKFDSSYAIQDFTEYNSTLSVIIDMKAPGMPGRYISTWAFEHSEVPMCYITFTITVLDK